ncbi:MAG: lipid-A-disaccharide synthase [Parvibaculales bacterium]
MSGSGLHIMIAAGESSGDMLGADLMMALCELDADVRITGLGGQAMEARGLKSLFPMADIAVMGIFEILPRLPNLLSRINQMAEYVIAQQPDALVLIDSPEFAHRVAKKVKASLPNVPIITYVAPTVWAWRQGRAAKMKAYMDHILAVLPFEPRVFESLNGPGCTYVGHSAIHRMGSSGNVSSFRSKYGFAKGDIIAVLPGSRMSEIRRLLPIYRQVIETLEADLAGLHLVIPAVAHLSTQIRDEVAGWRVPVTVVEGEDDKLDLFHSAHCALVASGTVSLELALVGLPMVVAYKMDRLMEFVLPRIIKAPSVVLPNLILDRPLVPEFLTDRCRADLIAGALSSLIANEGGLRDYQIEGFKGVAELMRPAGGSPSRTAAMKILELAAEA